MNRDPLVRTCAIAIAMLGLHAVAPRIVQAACTVSTTGLSFGTYDVFAAAPNDSTGTVTYRCTSSSDRNIVITLSTGGSGTFAARELSPAAGSDRLTYNLYVDVPRNSIWGDGSGGTSYYSRNNPPNNRDIDVTVYGRIPAQQDVTLGTYSDTIIVTINF